MIRGEKRRSELFHANVGEFFNNKGFVVVSGSSSSRVSKETTLMRRRFQLGDSRL